MHAGGGWNVDRILLGQRRRALVMNSLRRRHLSRACMPIAVACDGPEQRGSITVVSPGPDKTMNTPDDIRVPEPPES